MGFFGSSRQQSQIRIVQVDPRTCGCTDQWDVLEYDSAGRMVRTVGKNVRGYQVAQNIAELAQTGRA
jgi:hypothetical protein